MIGIVLILGGLALFMYGIRLLSAGMEKLAGDQIQNWLGKVTNGRLRSAGFGALATAFLQSSGLLMVTMIGLINAGLMSVPQSIGIMLGQEIGTTITAQIVAFDIGPLRLLLVIFGFVFLEYFPRYDWKKYGEILMGVGIVFIGMSYMASALDSLIEIPLVSTLLVTMGQMPLVGVLAGLLMTGLTQSSTAVTSMAVAMGVCQAIDLNGAIGIILGANIGSCITGFVASLSLSRAARQASMAQILINVIGVLLFIPFISRFADLVSQTSGSLPRQIANAHTIFNVVVSGLLFPFVNQLAKLSEWLTPSGHQPDKTKVTAFVDDMQTSVPTVALTEAARELTRVGEITAGMVSDSCHALINLDTSKIKHVIAQEEGLVDPIRKELSDFINKLMREDLSLVQQKRCFQMQSLLIDIERVGDLAEDIAEYAQERIENKVYFTDAAIEELHSLSDHAYQTYVLAIQAFSESDVEKARHVCRLDDVFDQMYAQSRQAHIHRIEAGVCQPEADVIFTETLRNLERISDHADNLGVSVSRTIPALAKL